MKLRGVYGDGFSRQLPSGRWQALFPDGKGEHKPLGTYPTQDDANRARLAARAAATEHVLAGTETLAEFGVRAIEAMAKLARKQGRDRSRKGLRNDLSRWKCWIVEHLPAALDPPECLDRQDVEQFAVTLLECESAREELVANGTMKNIMNLLRKVLNYAVGDGVLTSSPAVGVKVQKRVGDPRKQPNPLTMAELRQVLICPTYTARQRAAIGLVPFTGLRQGELAALEWTDVHNVFDSEHCTCVMARTHARGPHLVISKSWDDPTTKNGQTRIVWLIDPAVRILRAWHAHADRIRSKYVWGTVNARGYDWGWGPKTDKYHGVCYLGARREAGILRRVTFHHLRDTYASHLISGTFGRRWSIEEVATQLGHSTTYVTERYAGMLDDSLEQAAAETTGLAVAQPQTHTLHATLHGKIGEPGQVLGIMGRAHHDLNMGPSVPKDESSETIPVGYDRRAVFMQCQGAELPAMATRLLSGFASARAGMSDAAVAELEVAALALAGAVLESDAVTLAGRVVDNDRLMMTHAIELARVLTQHASIDHAAPAASRSARRIHNGQSGRSIGR